MKSFNKVSLAGRIHSYALEEKETEKGNAIVGSVTIEVAETGATVETRYFAYPKYSSGKVNSTYTILEDMMVGNYKTIKNDGDEADWISADAKIDVDYYIGRDGAKDIDEMSRSQKIRGMFLNKNKDHSYVNEWKLDMLITRIEDIEANEEKGYARKVRMHGYMIDDYNQRLMNVRFEALDEAPMNYLASLTVSNEAPLYTSVKGDFRVVKTLVEREGAFGGAETVEYENTFWAVTWMPRNTYEFGEDITEENYKAYMDALDEYKKEKFDKAKGANEDADNLVF